MSLSADERIERLQQARALDAGRDYAAVVQLLGELPRADLTAEPELGYLLAYARRRLGQSREALGLTVGLARPCRRRGRDRLWRRRLNLEGMLRFDLGQLARARLRWAELAAAAAEADDDSLVATGNNNLGIIATLQGRQDEALACYGRALAAYQRLGDRRGLAQAHQNLAISYRELGFRREAESHFREADSHARADGSEDVVGRTEQERAVDLLFAGDPELAEATAARALERFERIEDRAGAADAQRVLGVVALRRGHHDEARDRLDAALKGAHAAGAALTEAETLEALALLAIAEGDEDAADTLRHRADTVFQAMGAQSWGHQIRARLIVLLEQTEPED